MRRLTFKMKDFPKAALQPLQSIFIYNFNKQFNANELDPKTVIPYSVMQGYVTLDCPSSYNEIRAEQIVLTIVRQINLFDAENGNFEEYTEAEKTKLHRLLTDRNPDSKKQIYYKAIKELIKQKIYPPISLQKTLIQEAEELTKADIDESDSDTTEIKQGDLQLNSWMWTRIVNVFPNNPLRKETVYLATELNALNIKSIEELKLLTNTVYKRMFFVGTADCYRIAIQPEIQNINNLRNVLSRRIDIYKSQTDRYLTLMCGILFGRNLSNVKTIYELLNDANCNIDYDLRFSDMKTLSEIADPRLSQSLVESKLSQYVVTNRNIVANILTAIGLAAKRLYPLWKMSCEEVTYPEDFDELQVYYEGQGLDIDTLSTLMSIDAEEGNTKAMLQAIKKAGVKHPNDQLAYNIATSALKRKQITLSEKQYAVIEKRYNSLMRTAEMSKTIDAAECLRLANELNDKFSGQLNDTVKNIIESTLRYGICTERQLEVLRMTYITLTSDLTKDKSKVGPQIVANGLMFNLPDTTPTQQPHEEVQPKSDTNFAAEVKNNMTEDAYRSAFGSSTSSETSNSDSIWDD